MYLFLPNNRQHIPMKACLQMCTSTNIHYSDVASNLVYTHKHILDLKAPLCHSEWNSMHFLPLLLLFPSLVFHSTFAIDKTRLLLAFPSFYNTMLRVSSTRIIVPTVHSDVLGCTHSSLRVPLAKWRWLIVNIVLCLRNHCTMRAASILL